METNDVVIAPVAMSITTACALPEYVQTIPEAPAGRSSAGCDIGAARVSPRSELTVAALGHVRLDSAELGVAVGAAVGMAVEGAEVDDVEGAEVDAVVDVEGELPHATSVAANATGTTAARRSGVRMSSRNLIAASASPSSSSTRAPDRNSIANPPDVPDWLCPPVLRR
jgi:hypothetical protein